MPGPAMAITELRKALEAVGVDAPDRIDLAGCSILPLCTDLVVWCRDEEFRWRDGYLTRVHRFDDAPGAAMRILQRFRYLGGVTVW